MNILTYNKSRQTSPSRKFLADRSDFLLLLFYDIPLGLPKNKSWKDGKSQTAQGGAQRNPGLNA